MAKVIFFPKAGIIPVEVCPVRYGKSMLYTQDTDQLSTNGPLCEYLAFKNNVAATVFGNSANPLNQTLASGFVKSGRLDLSVYFPTDRWINPSTGIYELIPDYTATIWSAIGAAAFENATEGQPKSNRYPNHGQDMFDITNGRLGLNVSSGTIGENLLSEFLGVADNEIDFIGSIRGSKPCVFSYRNGRNDTPIIFTQKFIGGRNSESSTSGDSYTGYGDVGLPTGFERAAQINRPSSMRWWDFWNNLGGGTMQDADAYLTQEFGKTAVNNGWFNDFTHWHTAGAANLQYYFDMIGGLLTTHNVYSCTYEEAIKYLFNKSLVKRLTAKEVAGQVKVFVEVRDVFSETTESGLPMAVTMGLLDVPLSVRVDLSSTALAGKDVWCNVGGCFLDGGGVIIDLPLSNARAGVVSATISEATSPIYINIAKPALTTSGNTVSADQPCKFVVWNASYSALHRTDEFQYNIDVSAHSGAAYVGAISSHGQSAIIPL